MELEKTRFIKNLRSARRGLSPGLGGTRNEHLKILLEDNEGLDALSLMAQYFAEGNVPTDIIKALRLGKMTALRKTASKVRGLNAGETLRRLVAKTLAQQLGKEFEAAIAPYNFGLASHGGAEALVHFLQSIIEANPQQVITKVDGIGADDHIFRATMLDKLLELPTACKILPFVRLFYASISNYVWTDVKGVPRIVRQGEGGEQGDLLIPASFCLGIHDALHNINSSLHANEYVVAYLDDVYIIAGRDCTKTIHENYL